LRSAPPFSVVLDCKASRDGWSMSADDETRLANYVDGHRDELEHGENPFLLVMSSEFPSRTAVFETRQTAIAQHSARLVYLRATHLVSGAVKVESARMSCEEREALPWEAYLAQGQPSTDIVSFAERSA
jgi:hypothetical protein